MTRRTLQPSKPRPELDKLFEESKLLWDSMTAEERERMLRVQAESFARQDKD